MDREELYGKLARHLHQGIVGAPMSPALLEILKIMFTEEEAEIACRLPFDNRTIDNLREMYPERAETLETALTAMAKNGTVFTGQKPGKERKYRLLPTVVGWAEAPFWGGLDTEKARRLAPLWLQYRDEAFGRELSRGIPTVRVIPIDASLKETKEILPFDRLREKLDAVSYFAVAKCPCRQMMTYVGQGCTHSLENCLHFGEMGRFIVEQGMGREIAREEALRILEEADREGLVHSCQNVAGFLTMICNCCGCCCIFLQTQKLLNVTAISSSNYVSAVDEDACVGCGACEDRCPMGAIDAGDGEIARVDPARCIGCGACVSSCPTDAIKLARRETTVPPPEVGEFLTKRYLAPEA